MASQVPPKKNSAFTFYVSLASQSSTHTMQSNPTLAAGDVKVSTDGGALANITTLPVVTPASSKLVKVDLSASEMNGDNVTVIFSDAAGAEWDDLVINLQTATRQIDDLAYPATSGRSLAVDTSGNACADVKKWNGTAVPAEHTAGYPIVTVKDGTGTGEIDTASGVVLAKDHTGANLATASALATVQADTDDIQARLPAALIGGRMDASVGAYQSGQAPLQPTVAGRTLDIAATGEAGLDFDNIKDASGAHTLANITVPIVTTTVNLTTNNDKTGYGLSAAAVQAIWDALTSALTTAGSIGKRLADNIDAAISSRSTYAGGAVASVTGNVGGNVVGSVGSVAAGGITAASFAAGAIDSAAIATDAIGSAELAASAVTEIQAGLSTLDAAGVRAAVGLAAANLDTQLTAIDDYIDTEVAAIKAKTDLIPAAGPASAADYTTARAAKLDNLDAAVSTRATPAQVNAEVLDVMSVDTYAEPGQGVPSATATLAAKINYLFKAWRNKKTQTSAQYSLFADDGTTVDQKATVGDDGTTTTIGEITTGP